jgi:N-acetylmuramoyl-L-alanine amidase
MSRGKLEDWQYESWLMCRRLQDELAQANPYFRQNTRGIKSAGFKVLKNFYMPAVLVEVGFISNSTDLRYLVNPQFQQQTAVAIFNALNRYFSEIDPQFKAQRMTLTSSQGRR